MWSSPQSEVRVWWWWRRELAGLSPLFTSILVPGAGRLACYWDHWISVTQQKAGPAFTSGLVVSAPLPFISDLSYGVQHHAGSQQHQSKHWLDVRTRHVENTSYSAVQRPNSQVRSELFCSNKIYLAYMTEHNNSDKCSERLSKKNSFSSSFDCLTINF